MPLARLRLDQLTIEDEPSFAHVGVYAQLKRALLASGHRFDVPAAQTQVSWDRALFLNLTYWDANDGTDVLCEHRIPADVVAHVAWHHLAAKAIERAAPGPSGVDALLFAESIASAFDLYLVGRLWHNAPDSDFIATQVNIMGEAAEQAGATQEEFAALVLEIAQDPERAFEDLRALLFDVSQSLRACHSASQAQLALEAVAGHRFACLLHHYQLSNWQLSARANTVRAPEQDDVVRALDASLRQAAVSLDWLIRAWLAE